MTLSLRHTSEADLPLLSNWIAKDSCPQHNGVDPKWWLPEIREDEHAIRSTCIAVTDATGVLFYIKLENVMRCYIQFPPDGERDPQRTKDGLKFAFLNVAAGAKKLGYNEMIFESKSEGLVNVFTKFGFKEVKDNFLTRI